LVIYTLPVQDQSLWENGGPLVSLPKDERPELFVSVDIEGCSILFKGCRVSGTTKDKLSAEWTLGGNIKIGAGSSLTIAYDCIDFTAAIEDCPSDCGKCCYTKGGEVKFFNMQRKRMHIEIWYHYTIDGTWSILGVSHEGEKVIGTYLGAVVAVTPCSCKCEVQKGDPREGWTYLRTVLPTDPPKPGICEGSFGIDPHYKPKIGAK
jgi:hypothetical protein